MPVYSFTVSQSGVIGSRDDETCREMLRAVLDHIDQWLPVEKWDIEVVEVSDVRL